jgi:uncharacterized protein (TIGR03032 family)
MNDITQPAAPFTCKYTPNLPEFLYQIQSTIVISTYQAGKVIFISPKDEDNIIQLPRTFKKAMGIALDGNKKMAIATQDEVILTSNSPALAKAYPKAENTYDAFFMPRATFYTGFVDLHDLHFGNGNTLWGINTSFSALCKIDTEYSFNPVWKPHFITDLVSEDRCHLNGLAMQNGEPIYVSALGSGNAHQSWRNNITEGGILMNVPENEIILKGLGMPHSPRLYDGKLFVLLSAEEKVICVEPETGKYETIAKVSGFTRGMTRLGDYLFIGKSKLRKNSSTFKHLKIAEKASESGVDIIHIPTGTMVANLRYLATVDEIYDVQILPGIIRPNIANTYTDVYKQGLVTPNATYWAVNTDKEE